MRPVAVHGLFDSLNETKLDKSIENNSASTIEADTDQRKAPNPGKLHLQVPHGANTSRDK